MSTALMWMHSMLSALNVEPTDMKCQLVEVTNEGSDEGVHGECGVDPSESVQQFCTTKGAGYRDIELMPLAFSLARQAKIPPVLSIRANGHTALITWSCEKFLSTQLDRVTRNGDRCWSFQDSTTCCYFFCKGTHRKEKEHASIQNITIHYTSKM